MNTSLNTIDDLLEATSEVVATAAQELPPLTHGYDAEFLKQQTTQTIAAFYDVYTAMLPAEVRAEWSRVVHGNDLSEMGEWAQKHLDIEQNPAVRDAALAVFDQVSEELSSTIAARYQDFVSRLSSQQ